MQDVQKIEDKFSVNDAISDLWTKLDGWLDAIILKLPNFAVAILVLVIFYFIAKGIRSLGNKLLYNRITDEAIRQMISKLIFATIILIGFFVALGVMELDTVLTTVLASAGVVGLAIGLALQGTLSNTFSGLMLSFQPKIRLGDYIETNDKQGYVTEISLRNVAIRQTNNEYVVIPNSIFIDSPFTNYSLTDRSRVDVSCGVGYEDDLERVEKMVLELMTANFPIVKDEEIDFFFTEFGDSSINFVTRFWIDSIKPKPKLAAQHKAIMLIKKKFDAEGINIPFPIRTLDFGKNKLQMASKEDKN